MNDGRHEGGAIRSREHLLHMLAEASELEHNLLCSYLYAAFSLKRGLDEGLLPNELEAVLRWRGDIMQVCMEEMSHLAQIANLMVAVGSRPHFDRPVVTDLASADRALRLIVLQGEGAPNTSEASHFEKFSKIRLEFERLRRMRADFEPSRNVARNPVMRRPMASERVHVTDEVAAPVLDAANATYSLMLRCLTAVYDTPARHAECRSGLLSAAIGLMKLVAAISDELTRLPANGHDGVNAGVSFAMLRSTEGLAPGVRVGACAG